MKGYDITNMSNDDINNILYAKEKYGYDPDVRVQPAEKTEFYTEQDGPTPVKKPALKVKIFTAVNPEHISKVFNEFASACGENIDIQLTHPYTINDRGTSKHCLLVRYLEW